VKTVEKDKWESSGGSASPQYMLLYNGLMLVEFVTNAFRNLHVVFQLATLAGDTARFSLARGVGILKERADVDKALQLHFACNNLRAIHAEAARLEKKDFVMPAAGDATARYYRVLGLAKPSGGETTTVFSQWLDGLGVTKQRALTADAYLHYRASLNDFTLRAAAPFRKRAAADHPVTPDDTGIGRCYHGLATIDKLTGALPSAVEPAAFLGWLLRKGEAERLQAEGVTQSNAKFNAASPHVKLRPPVDMDTAQALQSEARPAAYYVEAEESPIDFPTPTVRSAGNCNGGSARDIYDVILVSDSTDNDGEVTPGTFFHRLTPASPAHPPGFSAKSSFARFTGTDGGKNAEFNAKLGYDRLPMSKGCKDCHPPEDVVINAISKEGLRVVQKSGGNTLYASRKLYIARCGDLAGPPKPRRQDWTPPEKKHARAARAFARWLASDFGNIKVDESKEVELQPIQHVHFIVLEREKEPLSWAGDIAKQLANGMRLVTGLRPHVFDIKSLEKIKEQRQADHERLTRLTGSSKRELGVQAHPDRAAFVELLDRSDFNRGQRGGKGSAKNGAPIILAFVGRGQVAPINDLQLLPFAAMGKEDLKNNKLVDMENAVRANYQGFWARWFADKHDTKSSKAVANVAVAGKTIKFDDFTKDTATAKRGFFATQAGAEAKARLNAALKITDVELPYVLAPAGCAVSDTVELKRATEKVLTAGWWWGKSKKVRHARGYVTHKLHTKCVAGAHGGVPELWERVVVSPKTGAAVYGSGAMSLMDYDAEVLRPYLWTRRRIIAHETDFAAIGRETLKD
jgi:hypothetical protein